jgi:predicted phosphohydrolase
MNLKILWLSDSHLDYLFPHERKRFLLRLSRLKPDIVLVGGDLSNASCLENDLRAIRKAASAPVYFVLGNHDYFGSSFSAVRENLVKLTREHGSQHWLEMMGYVSLMKDIALVGHGCWGDARIGSYWKSVLHIHMPDFHEISDLKTLNRHERLQFLKDLGEVAARHLATSCEAAAEENKHVIILTHVPPFPQVILDTSGMDESGLPFFSCMEAGKAIRKVADTHPYVHFTVLSGHTHTEARVRPMSNIEAIVQGAQYHRPDYRMLSLENGVFGDKGSLRVLCDDMR